jgi:hypothetical protein
VRRSVVSAAGAVQAGKLVEDPFEGSAVVDPANASPAARGYSPYAGRKYPTRPLFGDTHHHTSNSGDAFMAGPAFPEEAYRFARARKSSHPRVCRQAVAPAGFPGVSDRRGPG